MLVLSKLQLNTIISAQSIVVRFHHFHQFSFVNLHKFQGPPKCSHIVQNYTKYTVHTTSFENSCLQMILSEQGIALYVHLTEQRNILYLPFHVQRFLNLKRLRGGGKYVPWKSKLSFLWKRMLECKQGPRGSDDNTIRAKKQFQHNLESV